MFSRAETEAYARVVLSALQLDLDGTPLPLALVQWDFPDPSALRRSEGVIHLEMRTPLSPRPGAHQLRYRNSHVPDRGVYLANALKPESPRIEITAQRRDATQQELFIEFSRHDP